MLGASRVVLLDDLGRGGQLVRLADGPHAGAEVVVPAGHVARVASRDARSPSTAPSRPTAAAAERAEALLSSLLTPSQREQRRRAGTFWVHVERGWFRLGALYDIRFRSARWPWVERSVCVVSEGYEGRPTADLWAELAVVLAADPDAVVRVANWNGEDRPRPPASDRAGLTRWLERVQTELRRRRHEGDELHAAYLAFERPTGSGWRAVPGGPGAAPRPPCAPSRGGPTAGPTRPTPCDATTSACSSCPMPSPERAPS